MLNFSFFKIQGYILCKILWYGGRWGDGHRGKNDDVGGKMEKGEGKKEGNCMKNGVKGLEIFFLCYNLKKCRPAAAFLHARGGGLIEMHNIYPCT